MIWAAIALGATAALLLAVLFILRPHEDSRSSTAVNDEVGEGHLWGGRTRVAVCVDVTGVPGARRSDVVSVVDAAIKNLARGPNWSRLDPHHVPPVVDAGCPRAPVALGPDVVLIRGPQRTGRVIRDRAVVTTPGPYLLMTFVIHESVASDIFHGSPAYMRMETEEVVCNPPAIGVLSGGLSELRCSTVTTGLYLTPSEVTRPDVVENALAVSLSLKSRAKGFQDAPNA